MLKKIVYRRQDIEVYIYIFLYYNSDMEADSWRGVRVVEGARLEIV